MSAEKVSATVAPRSATPVTKITRRSELICRRAMSPGTKSNVPSGALFRSMQVDPHVPPGSSGLLVPPGGSTFLGWATAFYDFDADGDEDLFVSNGHVFPEAPELNSTYEQPALVFERVGSSFHRITEHAIGHVVHKARSGRSAAFGDLDNDGDIDIVWSVLNGPLTVLENAASPGTWLIVELSDRRASSRNHRGLGSRIELISDTTHQTRWIISGGSFQAASAAYAHFCLPFSSVKDRESSPVLRVTWPDGAVQYAKKVSLRTRMLLTRDTEAIR